MAKYFFLLLFFSSISFAKINSSEIEFQNSTIHFQAIKQKEKFQFSDGFGNRDLKIKSCNKKIVEKFWTDLVKHVESLQGPALGKGRKPTSGAWVKYEGLQYSVLSFEPSMKFFNETSNRSHVLFAESKSLCKE